MDGSHSMNRRGRDRTATDICLVCRIPAAPVRGRIVDLSHSGCRVELTDADTELGSTISLDLGQGERVMGEVVWAQGRQVGVRFHRALRSHIAVHWGIEAPKPVEPAPTPVPERDQGLLSHWMRRLGSLLR